MNYRVVHWGTGATGALGLQAVLERPDFALVGHYVHTSEKAGQDSATLIGRPPVGVIATQDMESLLASGADCLTYLPNGSGRGVEVAHEIAAFLERGINVVTTSLPEAMDRLSCPAEIREPIERACQAGNSTLFATGVDPGFATSHLALACYTVVHRVDQVRLQEFADYGTYPDEPTLRQFFGFGQPLDFDSRVSRGQFLRDTWTATVDESARALCLSIDDYRTTYRAAPAAADRETAVGRIERGSTSAMWFQLIGMVGGVEKIVLEHINWMHEDDIPKDWPQPLRYRDGIAPTGYRLVVEGQPNFDCEFQLPTGVEGLWITALHAVNAIPAVVAAPPGIMSQHEFATSPLNLSRSGAVR